MNKKEDLKERIKEVAKNHFLRFGYSRVKTDEIAKKCGISKRTLYELFSSKEDLAKNIITDIIDKNIEHFNECYEVMIDCDKDTFIEQLHELHTFEIQQIKDFPLEALEDFQRSVPGIWEIIFKYRQEYYIGKYTQIYQRGVDIGVYRSDLDSELLSNLLLIVFEAMFQDENMRLTGLTPSKLVIELMKLFNVGFITDEAYNLFKKNNLENRNK